jgi:peptidyl-prolyl cis-trans isomerase D
MLELMRKHAKNWLMKFLLGMIIIVFIFYFGTRSGKDKTQTVATVDGKEIALAELQKEYSDLAEFYRQRYGGSLTDEMLKGLDLKKKALDNLITQAIIMQKAKDLNIEATDDEVKNYIMAHPAFQRDGSFNKNVYQQMLRFNKMTPDEFEKAQKKMLSAAKLEQLIQESVKVSDQEILDFFKFQNEKINISYLTFSPTVFMSATSPSKVALETYLKEHGSEFRVPEQVQLKALFFLGRDYASKTNIPESDIVDYYERHQSTFAKKGEKAPPLSEVRNQIVNELVKISGMTAAAEQAKKAHDTIYQEENFDRYAAQNKLKIVTTNYFTLNSIPAPFNKISGFPQTVMELKKDDVSKVLSNEEGFFLIKIFSKKPSYVPALKDIEKDVAKRYADIEAQSRCRKAADAALIRLKKGDSLTKIAQENKISVNETGFFKPGGPIPKLGENQQLSTALYQLSERNPFPDLAFDVNGNFVILQFKEREKIDTTDYESKKNSLKQLILMAKRNEYFLTWLENIKASMIKEGKLKIKKDLKEL